MENTKILKRVNGQPIQIIEVDGNKLVPIRPICESLGITFEGQFEKLKEDTILSPTIRLGIVVAADGKQREMVCLPLKFVFGWLFTISPKNVREEARPAVIRYKLECYNVLFDYFTERAEFVSQRKEAIEQAVDEYQKIQVEFKTAKLRLEEAKNNISKERKVTFEEWKRKNAQLKLNFD
jgi:hypothetical protein